MIFGDVIVGLVLTMLWWFVIEDRVILRFIVGIESETDVEVGWIVVGLVGLCRLGRTLG